MRSPEFPERTRTISYDWIVLTLILVATAIAVSSGPSPRQALARDGLRDVIPVPGCATKPILVAATQAATPCSE